MSADMAQLSSQQVARTTPVRHWIESPGYDLAFFTLSPLLGLAWLLTAPSELSILIVLAILGIPHYLSTFMFYFWEDNHLYHRSRWIAFFAGPVGIVLLVVALVSGRVPYILQLAVYFWNAYHVARQSCGILSIYRHRAGVFDLRQKALANTAIIASNGCLATWNLTWHPILYHPLSLLTPALPRVIQLSLAGVSVVALLRLGLALWQRRNNGQAPGLSEMSFLCTSLLLFHPYLWVRDGSQATTGMLIGHFLQYLGIVWLLHRRKFTRRTRSGTPAWLVYLSSHTGMLLLVFLVSAGVYLALKRLFTLFSLTIAFDSALFMLVIIHFYLDRFFWAFKEPHIRKSMGPYLMAHASGAAVS